MSEEPPGESWRICGPSGYVTSWISGPPPEEGFWWGCGYWIETRKPLPQSRAERDLLRMRLGRQDILAP